MLVSIRVNRVRVAGERQHVVHLRGDDRQVVQVQPWCQGQVRHPEAGLVVPVQVGAGAPGGLDDLLLLPQQPLGGCGDQPAAAAAEHAEGVEVHALRHR